LREVRVCSFFKGENPYRYVLKKERHYDYAVVFPPDNSGLRGARVCYFFKGENPYRYVLKNKRYYDYAVVFPS
jgi:hypothetical protein